MSDQNTLHPEVETYGEVDTNLFSIARIVCRTQPKPPCTYTFILDEEQEQLDTGSGSGNGSEVTGIEFEMLETFTIACIRCLFGVEFNPVNLNSDQLSLLQRYINSIGYNLIAETTETEKTLKISIKFTRYTHYDKLKLSHLSRFMAQ